MTIMRNLMMLLIMSAFTACGTAPVNDNVSPATSPTQMASRVPETNSKEEVVQFLLTSAASDFRTHGPSGELRFRNVRVGHVMKPGGGEQYSLCGELIRTQEGNQNWTPFVT